MIYNYPGYFDHYCFIKYLKFDGASSLIITDIFAE